MVPVVLLNPKGQSIKDVSPNFRFLEYPPLVSSNLLVNVSFLGIFCTPLPPPLGKRLLWMVPRENQLSTKYFKIVHMQVFFFKQWLYIFSLKISNENKQRLHKIQKHPTSLFYHVLLKKQNECNLGKSQLVFQIQN